MIAAGAPLADILAEVCTAINAQAPGIISTVLLTVLLMDEDGKRLWPAAGPAVPKDWARARVARHAQGRTELLRLLEQSR